MVAGRLGRWRRLVQRCVEKWGLWPCIPSLKSPGKPIKHAKRRYERRDGIEFRFGRLKDWRRVATRYDRCPKVFLSVVGLTAAVMFRL